MYTTNLQGIQVKLRRPPQVFFLGRPCRHRQQQRRHSAEIGCPPRELREEKQRRKREATGRAYDATMLRLGEIPHVVLDEPDKDAQRKTAI
jgi:hypothetical protein